MSKGSYFLVYFLGDFTLDDAEKALRATSMTVTRDGEAVIVRWKDGPSFQISVNANEWVPSEALEESEDHSIPALANCKKRYEVYFDDLDEVLLDYNTLFEVEMTLQDLTRGWILLSWNGELLAPSA